VSIALTGPALGKVNRASARYSYLREVHHRIAKKDSTIWGEKAQAEAMVRLNWVDLPETSLALKSEVTAIASHFAACTRVVLCGMGGSSLAPEVLAKSFDRDIVIIDTTDPEHLRDGLNGNLAETVFVVSSKSGSTIETASQRAFFESEIQKAGLLPVNHMVFVTDPGSPLDVQVRSAGFQVLNADANVGGRFSALSAFGVLPAVLAGIDMWSVLDEAAQCKAQFLRDDAQILDVAYLLSEVAGQYIGFTDSGSDVPGLSDWIEQLIAESTGKDGKGRLPVVCESVDAAQVGGAFTVAFSDAGAEINVVTSLGAHFIFWEWVTAIVGAALEIDPFNQPNVTEAKEQTLALLQEWRVQGSTNIPLLSPNTAAGSVEIFGDGTSLTDSLACLINGVDKDGYIAIMAYLNRTDDAAISELRAILATKSGRPTTFGWGPRFLHSTGQFHKAGQPNGSFLQITAQAEIDFDIPTQDFSFATLLAAQALGDGKALAKRNYPLLRLHCKKRSAGILEILEAARAL
jgi:glucose-6-phosphate isomerase